MKFLKWLFGEKCEHCHGLLRTHGDNYYGGIEVTDEIGGGKKRTAYVCNLCYTLFKK